MDSPIIAPLISLISGILISLIALYPYFRRVRKEKDEADVDTTIADTMNKMVNATEVVFNIAIKQMERAQENETELLEKVSSLENDLAQTKRIMATIVANYERLWNGLHMIVGQLQSINQKPVFEPSDDLKPENNQGE